VEKWEEGCRQLKRLCEKTGRGESAWEHLVSSEKGPGTQIEDQPFNTEKGSRRDIAYKSCSNEAALRRGRSLKGAMEKDLKTRQKRQRGGKKRERL